MSSFIASKPSLSTSAGSLFIRMQTHIRVGLFQGVLLLLIGALPSAATASAELSLRDAINRSLMHNLGLQIEFLEPRIAEDAIESARGAFDIQLFSTARVARTEFAAGQPLFSPTDSDQRSLSVGANKLFGTGTSVTAQSQLVRSDDRLSPLLDLRKDADLSLTVRQPLLRGRGTEVNLARLRQARLAAEGSEQGLRSSVLNVLRATEQAYWGLAFAHAERRFRESSLQVAERLLDEARERESVGVATSLDVLQARAALAQRRDEIVRSQQNLEEAADRLRVLLADLPELAPLPDVPTVSALPVEFSGVPQFQQVWQQALQFNPSTARQEFVIEQRRQDRVMARDQVRPQLDLALTGGYIGRDRDSFSDALGSALDRDGTAWEVRLELSLPWGMRSQRAQLRSAERRLEQEELRLGSLQQDLLEQVRRQWRRLNASHERLQTADLVLELQRLAFEQETGRYEAGLTTFRAVLEAQRDLDNAQIAQLNAVLELISAEVDLFHLNGQLLSRHGFTWDTVASGGASLP